MKGLLPLAILLVSGATAATESEPSATRAQTHVTIQVVDFRGSPPFKRRSVRLPVADVAMIESAGADAPVDAVITRSQAPFKQGVQSRQRAVEPGSTSESVDFRGRPPFRRDGG